MRRCITDVRTLDEYMMKNIEKYEDSELKHLHDDGLGVWTCGGKSTGELCLTYS